MFLILLALHKNSNSVCFMVMQNIKILSNAESLSTASLLSTEEQLTYKEKQAIELQQ